MNRICIFGNLIDMNINPKGGGELQIFLLANILSKNGYFVAILNNQIKEDVQMSDNLVFISIKQRSKKHIPHIITLSRILKEVKCQMIYSRIMGVNHFIPLILSKTHNIKYFHGLASDLDVVNLRIRYNYFYKFKKKSFIVSRLFFIEVVRYLLLYFSDYLIAQNEFQKKKIDSFRKNTGVLKNIVEYKPQIIFPKNDYFIIVGAFDLRKGFRNIYQIIKNVKNAKFLLAGSVRDDESLKLLNELKVLSHVIYVGQKSRKEMAELISKAKSLISTSYYEGFPNVFLEAWSFGTPVISLNVDPDRLLQNMRLGRVFNGNINEMINYIANYQDVFVKSEMIKYIESNHIKEVVEIEMLNLFN